MNRLSKINKKSFLYAIWYSFATIVAILIYIGGLGDNTQGAMCTPYGWHYGKMYQWVWDNAPCVYSLEFYFGYYILTSVIYVIFDIMRQKIVGFNPSVLFRIYEGMGWFLINYVYLLWMTKHNYEIFDVTMCLMGFIGTSIFFLPLFLIFILSRKLFHRNLPHKEN